jgi:hypothetical protein
MSVKTGIGYSPLTDRVYIGKQNQEKGMWVGNDKIDITQDFIAVMFNYIMPNKVRTISCRNEKNMFLNVKKDKKSIEKAIKHLNKQLLSIK